MRLLNLRELEEKYGTNPLASYNIHKNYPQFEDFIMHPYTAGYKKTKVDQMLQQPQYFVGSSFLGDLWSGIKTGIKEVTQVAEPFLPLLVGLGREEEMKKKKKNKNESESESESEAEEEEHDVGTHASNTCGEKVHKEHEKQENKKLKKVKKLLHKSTLMADSMLKSNRRILRAELIRKIMKDRKVSMIKASQIIKAENLKY
jgi:hypothetical protein